MFKSFRAPPFKDMHTHLREGSLMRLVTPMSAAYCSHLLAMPNLSVPVTDHDRAVEYRKDLIAACGEGPVPGSVRSLAAPEFCMTLKLTQDMSPDVVTRLPKDSPVTAVKLYPDFRPSEAPAGLTSLHRAPRAKRGSVTTNAHGGVYDVQALAPVFEAVRDRGLVLCLHGAQPGAPALEAERAFLTLHLSWLLDNFPGLRIVLEHVSTATGVQAVRLYGGEYFVATITLHHLLLTHDDVVGGRLQPHHHCMPTPNQDADMYALLESVMSGDSRFFLGSDTAPHDVRTKECDRGCPGVFTAPVLPTALAQLFAECGRLDRFAGFTSGFAGEFYDLPTPTDRELHFEPRRGLAVPQSYAKGDLSVVPFLAGHTLDYQCTVA